MSTVLHRITKQYIKSADTPQYPPVDWIINPDLSAVQNVPRHYIKIVGNVVSEMSRTEKDVIDAGLLQEQKDSIETETQIGVFKPVIAALVKIINIRLPVDKKITRKEVIDAIRAEL